MNRSRISLVGVTRSLIANDLLEPAAGNLVPSRSNRFEIYPTFSPSVIRNFDDKDVRGGRV